MVRLKEIKIRENLTDEEVVKQALKKYKISENQIKSWQIYRWSIDARNKNDIHFVYTIDIELVDEKQITYCKDFTKVTEEQELPNIVVSRKSEYRPVIVGSGPAGLFAALVLAEHGIKPIIVEQGKKVDDRIVDVEEFKKSGKLNSISNIQFGEGGAGTFSDGKLNSGIHSPYCKKVLETFVKFGAPEQILSMNKPHVGTDNLIKVVKNIREEVIRLGGIFIFNEKVTDFEFEKNKLKAVVCRCTLNHENDTIMTVDTSKMNDGDFYRIDNYRLITDTVVLAIGHSSRDTFEKLYELGLNMEAKSFSVGARIEHKQEMINKAQYGEKTTLKLPSADYKLVSHEKERTVYTFCMCPGGVVVPSTSEESAVVTNGMSYYARDLENANSAVLVGVNPEDFEGKHPLRGMYFQRDIEHKAFEIGGRKL